MLHHKVEIEKEGFIAIEFCSYAPSYCPFEEFCTCKKYDNESDDTMEAWKPGDELPF